MTNRVLTHKGLMYEAMCEFQSLRPEIDLASDSLSRSFIEAVTYAMWRQQETILRASGVELNSDDVSEDELTQGVITK
jgi:hypothetical protein